MAAESPAVRPTESSATPGSPGRGSAVEFRRIAKSFGALKALDDFTLRVEPGEFLTLLGPSGSGKTTALNILAGFLQADAGDVLIGDRIVTTLPTERRNVGMVFQNYSLFPHMNVFENVAFPLRMRHAARADIRRRVANALALVHLEDHESRMPNQLSGGQQQRVAFARAIVFEPRVLLMDEPLAALDLKLREAMQLEIKHYQGQIGCTVVYVTHDQGEALTLSDRIVVMSQGRIRQVGSPQDIYDYPASRFVAEFIGQTNILTAQRTAAPGPVHLVLDELALTIPAPRGAPAGAANSWYVSVRPEKLVRTEDGDARLATFQATVDEFLFLGDVVRYTVRSPSGKTLIFKEPRQSGLSPLRAGDRVQLGFAPEDAVVVTE